MIVINDKMTEVENALAKIVDMLSKQSAEIVRLVQAQQRQQNEINNLRIKINVLSGKLK